MKKVIRMDGTMMSAVNAAYHFANEKGEAYRAFPTMYGWRMDRDADVPRLATKSIRVYPDRKVEEVDVDMSVLRTNRLV